MITVRAFGRFDAELDGAPLPLGGPRQRAVLAILVAARGRVVSVDRMIDDLWSGEPPAKAATSLQAYISNLRKLLEPGRPPRTPSRPLISEPPGYALRLPAGAVDAWRFEELVRNARELSGADPVLARALLHEAKELWRGPAFAEFADEPWARAATSALAELRTVARELHAACALEIGDSVAAVAEAERLTREEPLREEGWRLLALALWGSGRQADALAAIRRAKSLLARELGLDSGAALAEVESAILTQRSGAPRGAGTAGRTADAEGKTDAAAGTDAADPAKNDAPDSAGDADVFVGRESESSALAELATEAAAGRRCRIALVTGEAGIGKSTLLTRLRRTLTTNGWLVAAGRCPERDGAPRAWPWAEALAEIARAAPVPTEATLALAPLMSQGVPEPATSSAEGQFRLRRAVYSWLAAAARQRPIAILIDDLQWADGQTLALLADAPTGLADAPVLVVAAYRQAETDGRATEALAEVARHTPLRLPLSGLSEAAAATVIERLCEGDVDRATVAAITARSGGNPFYLRESVRLLRSEGELVAVSEVPQGVRDVLRRRLARLPEAAVPVLRLAAAAGPESEVEVLIEAADTDEAGVVDALEAGLIAGLLDDPAPGRVRFVHSLVRDALLADLSSLRAGRLLRAQVRTGAPSAALATRRRAVEAAEAAGREDLVIAAFTAWTVPTPWQSRPYGMLDKSAITTLERLLTRTDLDASTRCRLLNAYAVERADQGDPEARAAAEQAVALTGVPAAEGAGGDPLLRASTLATLSRELDADLEWKQKAAIGAELVHLGASAGEPGFQCYGQIVCARAAAAAGDPVTARGHVDELPGAGACLSARGDDRRRRDRVGDVRVHRRRLRRRPARLHRSQYADDPAGLTARGGVSAHRRGVDLPGAGAHSRVRRRDRETVRDVRTGRGRSARVRERRRRAGRGGPEDTATGGADPPGLLLHTVRQLPDDGRCGAEATRGGGGAVWRAAAVSQSSGRRGQPFPWLRDRWRVRSGSWRSCWGGRTRQRHTSLRRRSWRGCGGQGPFPAPVFASLPALTVQIETQPRRDRFMPRFRIHRSWL